MLHEYRIGFGVGYDRNGEPLADADVEQAVKIAGMHAAELFGGYSYWRCQGGWVNDKGEHVHERGVQWSILAQAGNDDPYNVDQARLRHWALCLAVRLNQQAFIFIGPDGSADIIDVASEHSEGVHPNDRPSE